MAIVDIGHTAFACADLDASLAFYERLGIQESFRLLHDDGSVMLVYLHIAGDRFLELFPNGPAAERRANDKTQSFRHLCLMTDDIEAEVARCDAAGIPIDIPPQMGLDFNTQAWITDPDGNRIEFMQISDRSPQYAITQGGAFPASETIRRD